MRTRNLSQLVVCENWPVATMAILARAQDGEDCHIESAEKYQYFEMNFNEQRFNKKIDGLTSLWAKTNCCFTSFMPPR